MMRPLSLICMLLAVGSGLYLYRVKYRAQLLDREISHTLKSADDARARAALLRADYALLNDPIRLQELVDTHLALKNTQPTQFTTLADFERRLPPIGLAPPEPPPEQEIPAAIVRPAPRALEPRGTEPKATEPRIAEPKAIEPSRPPAAIIVPAAPMIAAAPPRPAIAMAPLPAPSPRSPVPLALPVAANHAPSAAQVAARSASTPALQAMAPPRAATPAVVAPPAPDNTPPVVRSSLGMARRSAVQASQMPPGSGGTN